MPVHVPWEERLGCQRKSKSVKPVDEENAGLVSVEVEQASEGAAVVSTGVISDAEPNVETAVPGTCSRKMKGPVSQGTTHPLQPTQCVTLIKSCGHLARLST